MIRLSAAIMAFAVMASGVARADEPTPGQPDSFFNGWTAKLETKISPALGEPISDAFTDNYVDQSEFETAFAVSRPLAFLKGQPIEFRAGITAQPHVSDDGAQESSYYGQVTVGDAYVPFSRAIQNGQFRTASKIEDAFRPYVRYRFASVQAGIFDHETREEQQLSTGLRYRDIRWIRCTQGRRASDPYPCGDVPGWSWEARGELTYLWSTDQSRDRVFPTARVDVISAPFWGDVRAIAAAIGEWSFFQHDRVDPQSRLRRDFRMRLQGGLDMTGPMRRLFAVDKGISAELLARFQRNWSDRADKEHSRLYFVPSLTFTAEF